MARSALGAILVLGCGVSVPEPARTAHPDSAYAEVPYPPPAALVEAVPEAPNDDAVWVDGEWQFRGGFYVWERGGWVNSPPDARYAGWRARYLEDGRLLMAPGRWYREGGRRMRPPEVIAPAKTPPNEVTPEFLTAR